jgi:hypothetical protein
MAFSVSSLGLGFAAGLVVGVLGAWLTRSPPAERAIEGPAHGADDEPAQDEDAEASGGVARTDALAGAPASAPAQLRAEVAKLREELAKERARRERVEGAPVPFPAEPAERHGEQGLMTAVRLALAELKIGGDVTAVDCSENPCLASVRVPGVVDIDKLRATAALKAYAEDSPVWSASSFPEGENVLVLGFTERLQIRVEEDDPQREEKLEAFRTEMRTTTERKNQRARALFQAGIDARPLEPAPP